MYNTKVKSYSMTETSINQLAILAKNLQMKESEVIRELIDKASNDEITQMIILRKHLQKKGQIIIQDPTSHNVRDDNEKKERRDRFHTTQAYDDISKVTETMSIEEAIEIIKTPWVNL